MSDLEWLYNILSPSSSLLDNYKTSTGVSEEVTAEEIQENWQFIDAIMDTAVCCWNEDHCLLLKVWFCRS